MPLVRSKVGENWFWYREDDRYVGQRVALGKYEPYLTKLMLDNIDDQMTVVDVGANIGYDTVLFAKKAKNVLAFEPAKKSFEILKKNIKENKLKNVEVYEVALGSKDEKKSLYKSEENYGDNRINGNYELRTANRELVNVKRLDEVVKENIDLIKIDVQGWEPEVIEGARNIIRKYHPIIFFENSPRMSREAKVDTVRMWQFLRQEYGQIYFIDEYVQIYYPTGRYDKECNLAVGLEKGWKQVRDFWPKKLLKRILGRPAT